jgi:hypothetical protein
VIGEPEESRVRFGLEVGADPILVNPRVLER